MTDSSPGHPFPRLFEPLRIGSVTLRNRIVSSGHDTVMAVDGFVTDQLIAYQAARAAGGVGLIVVQVAGVHESARYTSHVLMATEDACIPGYRRLAEAVHGHGSADRRPDLPRRARAHGVDGRHAARSRSRRRPCRTSGSTSCRARCRSRSSRRSAPATPRRRGGCATPASTASRSWPATATCRRSSSTRASTCARTGTAAARRTGCDSCARRSPRSGPRSGASRSSGCASRSTRSRPRA